MSPKRRGLMPSIDRLSEPGSTFSTAIGVFLAYASPMFTALGAFAIFTVDTWSGAALLTLGIGSWFGGHWLAGR